MAVTFFFFFFLRLMIVHLQRQLWMRWKLTAEKKNPSGTTFGFTDGENNSVRTSAFLENLILVIQSQTSLDSWKWTHALTLIEMLVRRVLSFPHVFDPGTADPDSPTQCLVSPRTADRRLGRRDARRQPCRRRVRPRRMDTSADDLHTDANVLKNVTNTVVTTLRHSLYLLMEKRVFIKKKKKWENVASYFTVGF